MRWSLLVLALVACSPTQGPSPSTPTRAPAPPDPAPPARSTEAPTACERMLADYLAQREALNHCEREDNCAEVWPGLCPHGPYFINEHGDLPSIYALAQRIGQQCVIPDCEPPMELRPAGCREGRCVAGARSAVPPDEELMSCWDMRVQNFENDRNVSASIERDLRGITPLSVYGVPSDGRMTIEARWPANCGADCRLDISEHNSGMSRLVQGTRTREGDREHIELVVTAGDYYFLARSATATGNVILRVKHVAADDSEPASTRHGVAVKRLCEG